jgi:transcriptional regulator with XRE-family HTH domain
MPETRRIVVFIDELRHDYSNMRLAGQQKQGRHPMRHTRQASHTRAGKTRQYAYRDPVAAQEQDNGKRFARLLREYRTKAGLRQEDVVTRSGVSLSTIQRWESGNARNPKPDEVQAVCRVLGLSTVAAGVALGYLSPADVEYLPPPPRPQDPTVDEALSILEDPLMSHDAKKAALSYLHYLRDKQTMQTPEDRAAS